MPTLVLSIMRVKPDPYETLKYALINNSHPVSTNISFIIKVLGEKTHSETDDNGSGCLCMCVSMRNGRRGIYCTLFLYMINNSGHFETLYCLSFTHPHHRWWFHEKLTESTEPTGASRSPAGYGSTHASLLITPIKHSTLGSSVKHGPPDFLLCFRCLLVNHKPNQSVHTTVRYSSSVGALLMKSIKAI